MSDELPQFPTDDITLNSLLHSLDYCYEYDEEADARGEEFPYRGVGADYSVNEFLEFMSGAMDDPGELLPEEQWINNTPTYLMSKPRYTLIDVVRALIYEIRALRGES
jgi:hypothetical protein